MNNALVKLDWFKRLYDLIALPPEIEHMLNKGATLLLSYSGGKDSDVMLELLPALCVVRGWKQPIIVHCDLGRAEWYFTPAYVERRALETGLELKVVRRPQGDLQQRIEQNIDRHPGQIPFPSSTARFCTSEMKTAPTNSEIAKMFPARRSSKKNPIVTKDWIIVAQGIRAQESTERAKKGTYSVRQKTQSRLVMNWHPLFNFTLADVWQTLGESLESLKELQEALRGYADPRRGAELMGWRWHIAYALGNERVSCSLCILASKGDIERGAVYHPEYYAALVKIEIKTKRSFRNKFWLGDLRPDLLPEQVLTDYRAMRAGTA